MEVNPQLRKLGLFDARAPRYTSYPTAPHFSTTVANGDVAEWIKAITPGSEISLYMHVPFCRRLCWFCACRTQGTSTASPVQAYVETLKAELSVIQRLLPEGVTLQHLHWGGGTPTLMEAEMIREITDATFDVLPMAAGGEFSVEIDPNELDDARLDALAAAGMTRASIGVQDFDPEIQQAIGRLQSYEITKTAVDGLRARGITSLNADILYGLPFQTKERISESVQKLLTLSPDRVALFGYAHVPWMARRQTMIPTEALPSAEERLELFEVARELFVWDGYAEIGIDHFARPGDSLQTAQANGTLRRNFQGYTADTAEVLIGIGASSISRFPQGYAQNNPATSGYQGAVRGGDMAVVKGHRFTPEDKLRGRIIEILMCDFRVDLQQVADELDLPLDQVRPLADGIEDAFPEMVRVINTTIEILKQGRPLTRMIVRHFDGYKVDEAGHSTAV